jgi:cyclopropane-fatty-acyl-phospholipid synthase
MKQAQSRLKSQPAHQDNTTRFLDTLFADYAKDDFQVRLWNGATWGGKHPRFTLVLKHPGALRTMFGSQSELALGEAYIFDDFDIEGEVEAAFELAGYLLARKQNFWEGLELLERFHKLPGDGRPRAGSHVVKLKAPLHSKDRDRKAISYHYDLPAEFYELWLDRQMVYSCAYFRSSEDDLDTAQEQKLDYVCTKLRLRPGDRLLDIGCGWGALVAHAARYYGVEVVGITLSRPQAELAQQRLRRDGLADRCRVMFLDYRDLGEAESFDKIVSVGMFEHVGEEFLPEYFRRVWQLLRPGGTFLNHGIAYSATYRRKGASFADRYVFPDGDLVPISTSLKAAELSGFEVRDVESLREHYLLTLHQWVKRLEAHAEEARRVTDDVTYRIWRLYIAGAAHGFGSGRLNLFQSLLAKPRHGESGFPLRREDWYCGKGRDRD